MDEIRNRMAEVAVVNVREVADLLGINPRTVWRLVQTREIPAPIRLGQRVVRWRLADLREHLDHKAAGTGGVGR